MADVGHGATIRFATNPLFLPVVLSVDGTDITRESYETSHLGIADGYKTFMPGDLVDPGQSTLEIQYSPNQATEAQMVPINDVAESITITFPIPTGLLNGATFVCTGFVTSWNWKDDETVMTASIVIKWTGKPVWTNAS